MKKSTFIISILGVFILLQACNSKVTTEDIKQVQVEQQVEEIVKEGEMSAEYQALVRPLIQAFKNKDKKEVAKLVSYPLNRHYPIPSIRNEVEFVERFDEIFDEKFINEIANSNAATDWSDVGWRGIMLSHGVLWLDYDGGIIGVQGSTVEDEIQRQIIEKERKIVHQSLKNFLRPEVVIISERFKIRIDEIETDEQDVYTYRYASWEKDQEMSEKPDLIINGGEVEVHGTIGSPEYIFKNKEYSYHCSINLAGPDEVPPADLKVYKSEEEILYERAAVLELPIYRQFYEEL